MVVGGDGGEKGTRPRLVWVCWLSTVPYTRGLPVGFLVRAHAQVAGLVRVRKEGNRLISLFHIDVSPSSSLSKINNNILKARPAWFSG